MPTASARLCFVGPMVGKYRGFVTTQGERLAHFTAAMGYPVIAVSSHPNRYARLYDVVTTLITRARDIDVMMLEIYSGPSFVLEDIASWLGRRFSHRIIMTLHGGSLPEFVDRFPRWSRRVLARADAIVAPSPYLGRAAAAWGFRATVIPNSIDLVQYPYRHRAIVEPRLLWMRSFHPIYNPAMALRALARLRGMAPDATLVMAGQDKGIESEMRRLASSLELNDRVRFPGFLDMTHKIQAAEAADIFISTSTIDNTPVAVVEACAMGLPVVSTNVGGMADLLTDEHTGLLVPDDDDRALADAIERLMKDRELAARLSTNGRELARQFSWESVRPRWERLFQGSVE